MSCLCLSFKSWVFFYKQIVFLKSFKQPSNVLAFAAPCGGTVTGQTGIIQSVGYPDLHYQDNLLCEWFLQGPRGHYLTITLEDLDIQNSSECANDFVEIREYSASGLRIVPVFVIPSLIMLRNLSKGSWKHSPLCKKCPFQMYRVCSPLPCLWKKRQTKPFYFPAMAWFC